MTLFKKYRFELCVFAALAATQALLIGLYYPSPKDFTVASQFTGEYQHNPHKEEIIVQGVKRRQVICSVYYMGNARTCSYRQFDGRHVTAEFASVPTLGGTTEILMRLTENGQPLYESNPLQLRSDWLFESIDWMLWTSFFVSMLARAMRLQWHSKTDDQTAQAS